MATRIVLIADDLTGALDSASPFHAAGHAVAVAIEPAGIAAAIDRAPDILVINSDSRALDPEPAASRIAAIWEAVAPFSPRVVMKKVDSRLKGPVAAEVGALLAASGRNRALVCPAVPDIGRIVRDGRVQGAGVDLPIPVSRHMPSDARIGVADGADAEALRVMAAVVLAQPEAVLAVGARGLAQGLAEMTRTGEKREREPAGAGLPMIVAIGSRDPITRAQVEMLLAAGMDDRITLMRADDGEGALEPEQVAARLAEEVAMLVDQRRPATLLASGGETAIAIARALGIGLLVPEGELLAGIPVSHAPSHGALRFATKSGGFGDADALAAIAARALAQDAASHPASLRRFA